MPFMVLFLHIWHRQNFATCRLNGVQHDHVKPHATQPLHRMPAVPRDPSVYADGLHGGAIGSLLANDKMEYLQFITAERAAMAIWVVGIIGFIVKFIFWRLDQRRAASDPEQV